MAKNSSTIPLNVNEGVEINIFQLRLLFKEPKKTLVVKTKKSCLLMALELLELLEANLTKFCLS